MKNTIKVLGIIAIVAVIGFSMVSCKDDEEEKKSNDFIFKNQSSYTIQVDVEDAYKNYWSPNSFSIMPNAEQTVVNNIQSYEESDFTITWKRTDTNNRTGVRYVRYIDYGIFQND